jgi:fumarate reductase subunit C
MTLEAAHPPRPAGAGSEARLQARLWAAQRLSAMVLGLCVLVHLITLIYAVRGGLSGAEILQRTRASALWGTFYTVFVLAVAVHVPIGLRAILNEWLGLRGRALAWTVAAIAAALLLLGLRAVWAVIA